MRMGEVNMVKKEVRKEFRKTVQENFKDYLVFACINGRAAVDLDEPGKSDIDVFVVLQDIIPMEIFRDKWEAFVRAYRNIHIRFGYTCDTHFSGDFLTFCQLKECVSGRGFDIKDEKLFVAPISFEKESYEHDFLIFRSMLIIGSFLAGDNILFKQAKELSLETTVKFIFYRDHFASLEEVVFKLKENNNFGFDDRYEPVFSRIIKPEVKDIVNRLLLLDYITYVPSENWFQATERIQEWATSIIKRRWHSRHLLEWDLPFFKDKRAEIFKEFQ
jgi:predicted nucleotidyltransferase